MMTGQRNFRRFCQATDPTDPRSLRIQHDRKRIHTANPVTNGANAFATCKFSIKVSNPLGKRIGMPMPEANYPKMQRFKKLVAYLEDQTG